MKIIFLLGVLIVLLAIVDIIWTTLWIDGGAGLITNPLSNLVWRFMSKFPALNQLSGPITLMSVLFTWVILLWIGWAVVFVSHFSSITNTINQDPLVWQNFFYYAGYTIFTLGSGDYAPTSPFWQILTNIASGSGTLFLTLGASYILTIVGAVVEKRTFARSVFAIGNSSEEILTSTWNGENFADMNPILGDLATELSSLAVKHKAYPLLHYYHTRKKEAATALAIPIIDNVLSVMEFGISTETKPNAILLKKARRSVEDYLDTLENTHITIPPDPFVLPDFQKLQQADLPLVDEDVFNKEMTALKKRRQKLLGLINEDLWNIEDLE